MTNEEKITAYFDGSAHLQPVSSLPYHASWTPTNGKLATTGLFEIQNLVGGKIVGVADNEHHTIFTEVDAELFALEPQKIFRILDVDKARRAVAVIEGEIKKFFGYSTFEDNDEVMDCFYELLQIVNAEKVPEIKKPCACHLQD